MGKMLPPINLKNWIETYRDTLKPPVGNKLIWEDSDFMCFVVAGPNGRTDFHVNQGEEFFYQLEGHIFLKILEDGKLKTVKINAGEIFLLPGGVPHSPQRPDKSIGFVLERKRLEGELDRLEWWCPDCEVKMYEESFHLTNIVTQFAPVFERFFGSEESTCKQCQRKLLKTDSFLEMDKKK